MDRVGNREYAWQPERRRGTKGSRGLGLAAVLAALSLAATSPALSGDGVMATTDGIAAGPMLPLLGLFSATSGAAEPQAAAALRTNLDITAGPFISGHDWLGWGSSGPNRRTPATRLGAMVDVKAEHEVARIPIIEPLQYVFQVFPFLGLFRPRQTDLFLGAEFSYAGHALRNGEAWAEGNLNRFYFLVPLDLDFPILATDSLVPAENQPRENPFSIRIGVAPGVQLASPSIDPDVRRQLTSQGISVEESELWAFDLRVRLQIRMPLSQDFGILLEGTYDWAEENISGPHISLSSLAIMFGFGMTF